MSLIKIEVVVVLIVLFTYLIKQMYKTVIKFESKNNLNHINTTKRIFAVAFFFVLFFTVRDIIGLAYFRQPFFQFSVRDLPSLVLTFICIKFFVINESNRIISILMPAIYASVIVLFVYV